jgi:hypothetical protein
MRSLRLNNGVWPAFLLFMVMSACRRPYSQLATTTGSLDCVQKFKPRFVRALYKTEVAIFGKQLSGLLLLKTMPDSSVRAVFSSEMGFRFFDFEFQQNGNFQVKYALPQLNKPLIVSILRKDFELILLQNLSKKEVAFLKDEKENHTIFKTKKTAQHYIITPECGTLVAAEYVEKRKIKVRALMQNYQNGLPDTVSISHQNFKMKIDMKLLEPKVTI